MNRVEFCTSGAPNSLRNLAILTVGLQLRADGIPDDLKTIAVLDETKYKIWYVTKGFFQENQGVPRVHAEVILS